MGATEFLGYTTETAEAEIVAVVVDGAEAQQATAGQQVAVILNQTPFYAESGGQVGDTGTITGPEGLQIAVEDTQKKLGDLFVHLGRVVSGTATVGTAVQAEVDHGRRGAIRAHHSATHLLHAALRERLGEHVVQKGSLNAPDRLRFDVSQPTPISREDLAAVEAEVNLRIRRNTEVTTRLMSPDAAVAEGVMALFGEKYGDEVRVVWMGEAGPNGHPYSVELCGGHACEPDRRYWPVPDHGRGRRERGRPPGRGGDGGCSGSGGRGERAAPARGGVAAAGQPGGAGRAGRPLDGGQAAGLGVAAQGGDRLRPGGG